LPPAVEVLAGTFAAGFRVLMLAVEREDNERFERDSPFSAAIAPNDKGPLDTIAID